MISSQVGPFLISSDIALPLAHAVGPAAPAANATPYEADLDDADKVRQFNVSLTRGDVPENLVNPIWESGPIQVTDRRFLLKLPSGLSYYLEDGHTVTYNFDGDGELSEKDVQLFFLGPVFGALCAQQELLPLHASSLRHKQTPNKLFGFTGHSGAGKSTMGAAFTQQGYELFTDDILVLDPAAPPSRHCYSGHKGSKLWIDAVDYFKLDKGERISRLSDREKYYVGQHVATDTAPAQLDALYFITHDQNAKPDSDIMIFRRNDIHALRLFYDGLYRPLLIEHIMGRRTLYRHLSQLAATIPLYVLNRPFNMQAMNKCISTLIEHLDNPIDIGVPEDDHVQVDDDQLATRAE